MYNETGPDPIGRRGRTKVNLARNVLLLSVAGLALSACAAFSNARTVAPQPTPVAAAIHPEIWPKLRSAVIDDPALEARVADILSKMTVEEKVGQTIQADVASVSPADVTQYHLGSILDGGNSGSLRQRPRVGAGVAQGSRRILCRVDGRGRRAMSRFPVIWGSGLGCTATRTSSVPRSSRNNIGLGAARDPALLRRIGEITAIETQVVGQDWTFAPTIAVVRDDRWGRTYESYSEDPSIVREYAGEMVAGHPGRAGRPDFLRRRPHHRHRQAFPGDGGTDQGHDQGDNLSSEEDLRDIHSAGYQAAIAAGVQTVMVSYSSWHGQKMSGNRALLQDVLYGRLGFDGFVVSDWNAHGPARRMHDDELRRGPARRHRHVHGARQLKGLYANVLAQVKSGEIPMARLDQAVLRILRVKLRAGLFEGGQAVSADLWREVRPAFFARASRRGAPGGARVAGVAQERARHLAAQAAAERAGRGRRRRRHEQADWRLDDLLAGYRQ